MRRWGSGSVSRVATPVRAALQRFGLLATVTFAITLMVLGKADVVIIERARMAVADFMSPLLDAVSRPVESVHEVAAEVRGLFTLRQDNQRLSLANERLQRWEMVARRLERENASLRSLLHFQPEITGPFVSARVLADSGSAFVRTMLINVGADDGVAKGQAVIDSTGLVGRLVAVGHNTSRILLITDLNSRIPVVVENSRQRAILAGDNTDLLYLDLMPNNVYIPVGARIVTSGHGGLLPSGLPVGVVSAVGDAGVKVQPLVPFSRLEYVRVIDRASLRFQPLPSGRGIVGPTTTPFPIITNSARQ